MLMYLPGEAAALDKQHMPAGAGPIYTVLLTAKGKYLHDLFAYSLPGRPLRGPVASVKQFKPTAAVARLYWWHRQWHPCTTETISKVFVFAAAQQLPYY